MLHPICTPAAIRALDHHSIHALGIPSIALMETAARACCAALLERFPAEAEAGVHVVAGKGNNGGDGYAMARLLRSAGFEVEVWGLPGEHSSDCARTRDAFERGGGIVREADDIELSGGLVVDSLFGTGLDRPLTGRALARVQAMADSGLPILAVDMPSGLCGLTGQVLGAVAPAALTVTFGHPRLGQLLEPGADLVGALLVADIGLRGPLDVAGVIPDGEWVAAKLPAREAASHKGRHGHLAVVAGSVEMAGAAVLVCEAATRSGCGLVTLLATAAMLPRLGALPPEVMVRVVDGLRPEALAGFDAAAIGPGLGSASRLAVRSLWAEAALPAVFDADGLNALCEPLVSPSPHPRCITPHPGEAGRLLGQRSAEVQARRVEAARALSRLAPALLKGRHTLVHDGDTLSLNPTGSPAMATAGSGDVLTGLIGGLLARGLSPGDALRAGAFVHGYAGELAGPAPLRASDIASALPEALRSVALRRDVLGRRPLLP